MSTARIPALIAVYVAITALTVPFISHTALNHILPIGLIGSKTSDSNQTTVCKQYEAANKLYELHNVDGALQLYLHCVEFATDPLYEYLSAKAIGDALYMAVRNAYPLSAHTATLLLTSFLPTISRSLCLTDPINAYLEASYIEPYGRESLAMLAHIHRLYLNDNKAAFDFAYMGSERQAAGSGGLEYDNILNNEMCITGYYTGNKLKQTRGYMACKDLIEAMEKQQEVNGPFEEGSHDFNQFDTTKYNLGFYLQLVEGWLKEDTEGRTLEEIMQAEEAKLLENGEEEEVLPEPLKIVDTFTFYNEVEMLEVRLQELYDVVDEFILVEAKWTHAGNPKELYYEQNKDKYAAWSDKITHIVLEMDDMPTKDDAVFNENKHRALIIKGLLNQPDNTLVMVSDVDEIPDPRVINRFKYKQISLPTDPPVWHFYTDFYYYNLTYKQPHRWVSNFITSIEYIKSKVAEEPFIVHNLRLGARTHVYPLVNGWHMSYFMSPERIRNKIEQFMHQEYNFEEYKSIDIIQEKIAKGEDLFRSKHVVELLKIPMLPHRYLPAAILDRFFPLEDGSW